MFTKLHLSYKCNLTLYADADIKLSNKSPLSEQILRVFSSRQERS